MKIGVIGSIMQDEIFPYNGERKESFGGILYNVLALASIFQDEAEICPVCWVGESQYPEIRRLYLDRLRNVNVAGIKKNPSGNDQNTLRYITPDRREEKMTLRTPPLAISDLKPALDAEVLLINFITGREIELSTLEDIRLNSRAFIFLDVHNLCREVDADGHLRPRRVSHWKRWAELVNALQANDEEIALFSGAKWTKPPELLAIAQTILDIGTQYVLVTLGSKGSMLAYRKNSELYHFQMPVTKPRAMMDTTGCGDSFSAGFLRGLLAYHNSLKAIALASVVAGLNCESSGLMGARGVRDAEKRLADAHGELIHRIEKGYAGERF
jgi:sugar/nucleoside kinase (ribokinase family)